MKQIAPSGIPVEQRLAGLTLDRRLTETNLTRYQDTFMLERLHLENVGPAAELTMELGPRLNLITGDNGLGKSFLLDVAWWALTRRWPHDLNPKLTSGYMARPTDATKPATINFSLTSKTTSGAYKSTYVARDQAWIGKAGRRMTHALVLHARADGGFSVWDPARNYWKKKGSVDVQERQPGYVFSAKEVLDGLEVTDDRKRTIVCNGLIWDWACWVREKGANAELMSKLLGGLASEGEHLAAAPPVRLSLNDVRDIPSIRTSSGAALPILHASGGIRRMVALAYLLLWSWNEHALAARLLGEEPTSQLVILFDDLESHLHPRWQRSILKSLLDIGESLHANATVQLVATTHSPLVLASAEPFFDRERDAWLHLDRDHGTSAVTLTKRPFFRRGDISHWLTSEAFNFKEARSLEAETAITAALALRREEAPTKTEIERVDSLLRASLGDIDHFWVRWSAWKESRET